jgi:hypothetical protein
MYGRPLDCMEGKVGMWQQSAVGMCTLPTAGPAERTLGERMSAVHNSAGNMSICGLSAQLCSFYLPFESSQVVGRSQPAKMLTCPCTKDRWAWPYCRTVTSAWAHMWWHVWNNHVNSQHTDTDCPGMNAPPQYTPAVWSPPTLLYKCSLRQ